MINLKRVCSKGDHVVVFQFASNLRNMLQSLHICLSHVISCDVIVQTTVPLEQLINKL